MLAEALASYRLELPLSQLKQSTYSVSGGQLSVIGYGFPLRQCQLPATWKQVSDTSWKAFSRGLVLGYSKE